MNTFDIIIALALVLGIGYALYLILQDPLLIFKSLLRGMKNHTNVGALILFFPIWGPMWLLDKAFNLKIFINDFEDASKPKPSSRKEHQR